jgi:bifunctional DNA-binding transcriptional regulator/antitoxin component of YhaV-PrlF toxin-antitoxin module
MLNEANYIGKMIEGGRITVPEAIRMALNLKQEDLVQVCIKKLT